MVLVLIATPLASLAVLGAGNDILYVGNYNIGSSFTLTGGEGFDKIDFSERTSVVEFDFASREFEQAIGSSQDDIFTSDDNANNINGERVKTR